MRETIRTSVAIEARLYGKSVDEARTISDRLMKLIEEEERRSALEERKRRPS